MDHPIRLFTASILALFLIAGCGGTSGTGGESTRPGADALPAGEELRRVLPVVERLAREVPVPISIDTSKPAVAEAALASQSKLDIQELSRRLTEKTSPEILELVK